MKLHLFLLLSIITNWGYAKSIHMGGQTIDKGIMQAILAKEICSCIFNTDIQPREHQMNAELLNPDTQQSALLKFRKNECLTRSGLPISAGVLKSLISLKTHTDQKSHSTILSQSTLLGHVLALKLSNKDQSFTAIYLGPKKGCRLLTPEEETNSETK